MSNKIYDDIFGLQKLDSLPLPNSYNQNKQQKLNNINIKTNKESSKENENLFEEYYFPELIKKSKEGNQQIEQKDFFTEHFERFVLNYLNIFK